MNAVKALDDMTLEVLGLPFGEDRQGQLFDLFTNIELEIGQSIPVYFWHGFAERAAKSVGRIGKAFYERVDQAGHWFRVQLDKTSDIARRIYDDAKAGKVRASSDSASHLVRPAGILGKPGRVTNWPIFALSLMDASTAEYAVNPRAVAFAAAKAFLYESEAELAAATAATGEAAKAGAAFARRNRDRILEIKRLLDEMMAEFPDVPNPDMAATEAAMNGEYAQASLGGAQVTRQVAAKSILELAREDAITLIDARISAFRRQTAAKRK